MIPLKKRSHAAIALLLLWVSMSCPATVIYPVDASALLDPPSMSASDKRFITGLLMDFSPISSSNPPRLMGFTDPLGTGIDTGLQVFAPGKVLYLDLLWHDMVSGSLETPAKELPPQALQGVNPLDNLNAIYFSYDGRAFDKSLWDLRSAEIIERDGLPVTSETSPLSLSGFGVVSDNLEPLNVHWSRCPAQDKRTEAMAKNIKSRRHPCSIPGVCQCYGY